MQPKWITLDMDSSVSPTYVNQAINWTRLSCNGMAQNEVRPQLHALAYNLGIFLQGTDLLEEMVEVPIRPKSESTRPPRP